MIAKSLENCPENVRLVIQRMYESIAVFENRINDETVTEKECIAAMSVICKMYENAYKQNS